MDQNPLHQIRQTIIPPPGRTDLEPIVYLADEPGRITPEAADLLNTPGAMAISTDPRDGTVLAIVTDDGLYDLTGTVAERLESLMVVALFGDLDAADLLARIAPDA